MRSDQVFVRTVTSDDLEDCARLFVRVFSEWPYRESWSLTRAHQYLGRFRSFDPERCISHLYLSPSITVSSWGLITVNLYNHS